MIAGFFLWSILGYTYSKFLSNQLEFENKDSIFFIGSVFNESIFNCGFQISPATNRWQKESQMVF